MKVVVTGAAGQLGTAMVARFGDHEVVPLTRRDLDLTDPVTVRDRLEVERPELLINCAAYNHVDAAETDPLGALQANALAVRSLAQGAARSGAVFVHFGTDFVFDGRIDRPYREDDPPAPLGVYAWSKLVGEWFAAGAPAHYVLRVESLFGGLRRRSSIDRIVAALRAGRPARVFVDRTVSPSYVHDVARATRELVERQAPGGLYHCVNSGQCTWHELGMEIARLLGVPPDLEPVPMAAVTLPAARPTYAALSNARLAAAGVVMPSWQDALARHLSQIAQSRPADT